jgi:hypothetical protein
MKYTVSNNTKQWAAINGYGEMYMEIPSLEKLRVDHSASSTDTMYLKCFL